MKSTIFFIIAISTTLLSCRKFVQVEPAPDLIQTVDIFESDRTALAAVSGIYTQLRSTTSAFTNGGMSLYGGLLSDDLYLTGASATAEPFFKNELLPTTSVVSGGFYSFAYKIIYQTNAVLEGLRRTTAMTEAVRKQLFGEMLIIRSLMYFYLSNLFGDLPLVVTSDYRINATMPRSPINLINQQIITDLLEAQQLLTNDYPTAGRVRANRMTATALLARVYCFQKHWADAATQATSIIQSNQYSLRPAGALNTVFLKNSSETIFEIASPNENTAVGDAILFLPASATVRPAYALTNNLILLFESTDQRKLTGNWVGKNTISGIDYFFPAKFKQRTVTSGGSVTEYQIVFRLAELYLIRAEASARLGQLDAARSDLNIIRTRAGLPPSIAATSGDLLTAIAKERRLEFFGEWGHRWLDLKRTGQANAVLGPIKGSTWQTHDQLFPLPEIELIYNPSLVQNPGY